MVVEHASMRVCGPRFTINFSEGIIMKRTIQTAVCKFFLVLTAIFCLLMGTSVLEGSIALFPALLYCGLNIFCADLLCRLLLPAEAGQQAPARKAVPAGQPAARRTYAPGQVPIHVVSGGKAA